MGVKGLIIRCIWKLFHLFLICIVLPIFMKFINSNYRWGFMIDRVPKFMDTPADGPHFGIIQSRKKKLWIKQIKILDLTSINFAKFMGCIEKLWFIEWNFEQWRHNFRFKFLFQILRMSFDLLVTFHGNSVVVVWCSLFTPRFTWSYSNHLKSVFPL